MRAMLRTRTVLFVVGAVGIGLVFAPGSAIGASLQQVFITNDAAHPVPVAGAVSVSNLPSTQTVTGSVNVGNLPATQPVSGSVSVSNLPATQTVSGTVNVGNFPGSGAQVVKIVSAHDLAIGNPFTVPVEQYRSVRVYYHVNYSSPGNVNVIRVTTESGEPVGTIDVNSSPGNVAYDFLATALVFNFDGPPDIFPTITVYGSKN